MKKLFAFLAITLFLASCSSDDDNNNNGNSQIVGKWVFNTVRIHVEADKASVRTQAEKDKQDAINRAVDTYLEFSDKKYTNTYEGFNKIDYYTKDGYVYFKEADAWENWKYTQSGDAFTFVLDETEDFKSLFPEGGVKKVVFYWDYVRTGL